MTTRSGQVSSGQGSSPLAVEGVPESLGVGGVEVLQRLVHGPAQRKLRHAVRAQQLQQARQGQVAHIVPRVQVRVLVAQVQHAPGAGTLTQHMQSYIQSYNTYTYIHIVYIHTQT